MLVLESQEPSRPPFIEVTRERPGPGYVQMFTRLGLYRPQSSNADGWVIILHGEAGDVQRTTQASCPAVQPFLEGIARVDPGPLNVPGISPPGPPPMLSTHPRIYTVEGYVQGSHAFDRLQYLTTERGPFGGVVERFLTDAESCWSPVEPVQP
jgi:hypothetical protein